MTETKPTVVFDFDLTLTRWDTADRFFRWLLKRQAWRMALVLLSVPALVPLLLVRGTRKWPVRYAVWVATLGCSHDDLHALATEHTDSLFAAGPSVFLTDTLAQLQHHLDRGDRVVIATGCLEVLARELLERAGYGHVPLVGSSLKPWLGGMVRHEHCFGPNKPPMLSRLGFAPPWAIAYTDHQCDLPVLELSTHRFLVNPKPDAIQVVGQALLQPPTVLQWR